MKERGRKRQEGFRGWEKGGEEGVTKIYIDGASAALPVKSVHKYGMPAREKDAMAPVVESPRMIHPGESSAPRAYIYAAYGIDAGRCG